MNRRRKPACHVVRDIDQLRALASPVRIGVMRAMEETGPCTVGQLAVRMDRKAVSLYYHVHALVDAGLVEEVGKREGVRRPEKIYDTVARTIRVDPENQPPEFLEALADLGSASLRQADRMYRRAVLSDDVTLTGPTRERAVYHVHVRVSTAGLRELNRRIEEFVEEAYELDREGTGKYYTVTIAMSPA